MTPIKVYLDTLATDGATAAAWEAADWWLDEWRRLHPEDEREDVQVFLEELVYG
jgi:hypothetical protein